MLKNTERRKRMIVNLIVLAVMVYFVGTYIVKTEKRLKNLEKAEEQMKGSENVHCTPFEG
jgi:cell division protein FtsN